MNSLIVSNRPRPDHICIDMPEIFPEVTKEIWSRRSLSVDEKIQALKDVFSKEPAVRISFEHWMTKRKPFILSSPLMTDLRMSKSHSVFFVAKAFFKGVRSLNDGDMETLFLQKPKGFTSWFNQDVNRCQKAVDAFVEYVELGMFSVYHYSFFKPILSDIETLIKVAQVSPESIKRLFTVEGEQGSTPLSDSTIFVKAIPFFKRLKQINKELLWEILKSVDSMGNSPLHSSSNVDFFSSILSLCTGVKEKLNFLKHSFFILNNNGKMPVDDRLFFSKTIAFLMDFSEENPQEVLTLLSTKTRNGKTLLHNPDHFKSALPLLMQLIEIDWKGVYDLLYGRTIEDSLAHEDGIFRLAIPLLEKIERVRKKDDELCNKMTLLIREG